MTSRALSLVVLAIVARSARGARSTEVNGDMAILEVKRLQEEGQQPLVDALLQGTTTLAIGHVPDSAEFAVHVASFEAAARGLRFHAVEDTAENAQERRELFGASCATLAALSAEVGSMRAEAAQAEDRDEL